MEAVELHQPAGVLDIRRPEEDLVGRAEHGGVRADAQRQSQNGRGRIAGRMDEPTHRVPDIVQKRVQKNAVAVFVEALAGGGYVAEGAAGKLTRHALREAL